MSYDLFFKPRSGLVDPKGFVDYFSSRPNYKVNLTQARYRNEDTGVYFVFDLRPEREANDGETYPVSLNINYFRPSYFILEAEPEVTALVRSFDLVVSDPQAHGMGEGEYDPELLKTGWNHGNDFGCFAFMRVHPNGGEVYSLPTAKLIKAWSWNANRRALQNELGASKFLPRVKFILLEGQVATAAVWPDGIPIAIPEVDYLLVLRRELAPRRFLKRREDRTLVALKDASPLLGKHRRPWTQDVLVLDYSQPPRDVVRYVESLPKDEREIKELAPDQVLNRELLEKYLV
ncbi:MAG: hypothetical protein AB1641_09580 [Thermodesulfobacteriota bacterium]